ncbi:MAG: DUF3179 domain-containing (seleno)protein [Bacteroidota bacterium]
MYKLLIYILIVGTLSYGCSKENSYKPKGTALSELEQGWVVPLDQLVLSQLPADRIKSIDTPHFEIIDNENLSLNDIAYVYRYCDTIKIYPQRILSGHEIVNDRIGNHHFAITYCPLTGSAIAWEREINGIISEFGVSGHLFNENLIPYDRNGHSFWSQMRLEGVRGENAKTKLKSNLLLQTTGKSIKIAFPDAIVLVDSAGHNCNDSICGLKNGFDFGDPDDEDNFVLPSRSDYFGIVNTGVINGGDGALLFNYDIFGDSITLYNTSFRNSNIIVLGSTILQFIVAFDNNTNIPSSNFYAVQNALPVVLADNLGNRYDITGEIISGPSKGNRLPSPDSYTAHSFAWELFFGNNIDIFEK